MAYTIQMEIAGNTAMWTRPDTGDSPVSYPAPTYSAAKAIMEELPSISIPSMLRQVFSNGYNSEVAICSSQT